MSSTNPSGRPLTLRLFADNHPAQQPQVHRTQGPVATRQIPSDDGGPARDTVSITAALEEAAALACFEEIAAEYADDLPALDEAERAKCRTEYSVAYLFQQYLEPYLQKRVRDGKLARGTLSKHGQAVRRFDAFDSDTLRMPAKWPRSLPWRGMPVAFLSAKYFEAALAWMLERPDKPLAPATVDSTWKHLRTVMGLIVRIGGIERVPGPVTLPDACDEDDLTDIYTPAELEAWFAELPTNELRAAIAVGLVCGARTEDLFGLRWKASSPYALGLSLEQQEFTTEKGEKLLQYGEVDYRAQKTGKRHWCPLPAFAAAWLREVPSLFPRHEGSLVFAGLWGEKPKRRRNADLKAAQKRAGIPVRHKPIQVLRATCNKRLNDHRRGLGRDLIHGPDSGINSRFYDDNSDRIREGVLTLKQPPAFEAIVAGG